MKRARGRGLALVLATVGAFTFLAIFVLLRIPSARPTESPATPTPAAVVSPTPAVTPSATPSRSPLPPGTFEDVVLGYRITFPDGYRRSRSSIVTGQDETLGGSTFTQVTEQEERDICLRDIGHVGFGLPDRDPDVNVFVSRNVRGISAVEWVTTPRVPGAQPRSTHQKVEPVTLSGLEAVRLVADNASAVTNGFAIRANDRMYELYWGPGSLPHKTWLDDIASTFVAIPSTPFPTPAPTTAPSVATAELGQALSRAFAARDAVAVARLIWPRCWLNVGSTVPSGGHGRAVPLFIAELQAQFARADFSVSVDPQVQVESTPFPPSERYFVRSTWNESGRVTQIHLFLDEFEGRWYWSLAMHQHQGGASYSCLWAGSVGGTESRC